MGKKYNCRFCGKPFRLLWFYMIHELYRHWNEYETKEHYR